VKTTCRVYGPVRAEPQYDQPVHVSRHMYRIPLLNAFDTGHSYDTSYTWFPALRHRFRIRFRNRFRKKRFRTCRSVNAVAVCRCRGV